MSSHALSAERPMQADRRSVTSGRRYAWLGGARFDAVFLQSAFWILPAALTIGRWPRAMSLTILIATCGLWFAHRAASAFTALTQPGYLAAMRANRRRFLMPAAAGAAVGVAVLALWHAAGPAATMLAFATVFLVTQHHHAAMQHYGVLRLYGARAGEKASAAQLAGEKRFCLTAGGALVFFGQILQGRALLGDTWFGAAATALPAAAVAPLRWLGVVLVVGAGLAFFRRERARPTSAKCLYAAGVALQPLATLLAPPVVGFAIWVVQHWLVSVGLAVLMARPATGATDDGPLSGWYRLCRGVATRRWPAFLLLVAVSAVLTPLLHDGLRVQLLRTPQSDWTLALLVAAGYGSLAAHYSMDRTVFRMSDPLIRRASGTLLFGPRP